MQLPVVHAIDWLEGIFLNLPKSQREEGKGEECCKSISHEKILNRWTNFIIVQLISAIYCGWWQGNSSTIEIFQSRTKFPRDRSQGRRSDKGWTLCWCCEVSEGISCIKFATDQYFILLPRQLKCLMLIPFLVNALLSFHYGDFVSEFIFQTFPFQ